MYVCQDLDQSTNTCTNWVEVAFYAAPPIPPDSLNELIGAVILLFSVAFGLRFIRGFFNNRKE